MEFDEVFFFYGASDGNPEGIGFGWPINVNKYT